MTLISSLNIAKQALAVNEAALTVVSNNIANVNTEGYSKQRAELSDVVVYDSQAPSNNIMSTINSMSGVEITGVKSYASNSIQNYYMSSYRNANSSSSYYDQASTVAAQIESLTNELQDSGLTTALNSFYTAAGALSSDPSDSTARVNFVSAAQNVCSVFNSMSTSLSGIQESLVGTAADTSNSQLSSQVDKVNSLLDQIADVNSNIFKVSSGNSSAAASLNDQRTSLLNELSSLVNVKATQNNDGTVNVSLGNLDLVSGTKVTGYLNAENSLDSSGNIKTTLNIVNSDKQKIYSNVNDLLTGGSLKAIVDIGGSSDASTLNINNTLSQLNKMAQSFANIVNTIQRGDPNSDGSVAMSLSSDGKTITKATNDIFVNSDATTTIVTPSTTTTTTTSTGITAANISVNSAVIKNTNLVAAARLTQTQYTDYVASGKYADSTGNNTNVTLLQNSRSTKYDKTYDSGGNETDLGNVTVETYLSNFVGAIGSKVDAINTSSDTQSSVLSSIKSQLNSQTGVNLDEELTDMLKYQRAYEAAARVFSTVNSVLQELIQLGT